MDHCAGPTWNCAGAWNCSNDTAEQDVDEAQPANAEASPEDVSAVFAPDTGASLAPPGPEVELAPKFDPDTGAPLEPAPKVDPDSSAPLEPAPKVEPDTVAPLEPAPKFEPDTTGAPLEPTPKVDPDTETSSAAMPLFGLWGQTPPDTGAPLVAGAPAVTEMQRTGTATTDAILEIAKLNDPFMMDQLGYARVTRLQPNGWRIKCFNGLVCMRRIGVCLLDQILPMIPEPTTQTIAESWSAMKEIDTAVANFTCDAVQPCTNIGQCADSSFKVCLCIPCFDNPPLALVYEGMKEHTLTAPTDTVGKLMGGPKMDVVDKLFITDERTCCQRCCGCKKGLWTIYHDGNKIARVYKGKAACTCASYYKMVDVDNTLLARMKISPTCCELLNNTCRKLTCQCCCLCRVCDLLRCKCCRAIPTAKILAPTSKELMSIFNKAKCCKAPKSKVMYRTLYVPDQDEIEGDEDPVAGEEQDLDDTTDDDPEAVAVDATVVAQPGGKKEKGPKPYEKYNKQTKGEKKGQPGELVKMYVKKPPFFCVGFCRYVKTMTCMVDLGPMEDLAAVADMAGVDLTDVAGEVAEAASGVDVNAIRDTVSGASEGAAESSGTGSLSSMASDAASSGRDMGNAAVDGAMDAQGVMIGDPLQKKAGTDAKLKDYKKVKEEAMDIQLGEGFTTSQKWGALLYVLYEMKQHQF